MYPAPLVVAETETLIHLSEREIAIQVFYIQNICGFSCAFSKRHLSSYYREYLRGCLGVGLNLLHKSYRAYYNNRVCAVQGSVQSILFLWMLSTSE